MKKPLLLPVALVVTPNPPTLTDLRRILKRKFQLIEREDVSSAQELLQVTAVDLILLNARPFEEKHLFQTLSCFRKTLGLKKTPIVVMTDSLKKKFATQALKAGATDLIHYPLDEKEIEQQIGIALQASDRRQQMTRIAHRSISHPFARSRPLTHRKILNDRAIKEISKARCTTGPVSLLIVELDDRPGRGASPSKEALHTFSTILQSHLRKHDILIPHNCVKYVVLLPKTSARAAELIATAIRADIEHKLQPFSVSMGLTSWEPSKTIYHSAVEAFHHLLQVATQAVHEAKKTGSRIMTSHSV